MWSGPRNVSTAMMYSWRQRSDTLVIDEPWYAHYLMHTGVEHPDPDAVIASQPVDPTYVVEGLLASSSRPIRFLKNMAHHLVGLDPSILDLSDNCLLVRDPRDMLPSLMAGLGRVPTIDETGLGYQVAMFDRMAAVGAPPPVIVTSSLLRDPTRVLTALCGELGIEFDPASLSWPAGPKPEDGVWARHWYASVHETTGFAPYEAKPGRIEPELIDLLERCEPLYERLVATSL